MCQKKNKNSHNPISLHAGVVQHKGFSLFFFFLIKRQELLCVQQNLSPTLQLDLTWFRTDYDLVYVLLESLTGKQGWSQ